MSIPMLRLAGMFVFAVAALPGRAADERVCIGTYGYSRYELCKGSPGNVNYALFIHRGQLTLRGTFRVSSDPFGLDAPLQIQATAALEPGFPITYTYRGMGQCSGEETFTTGVVEPALEGRWPVLWIPEKSSEPGRRAIRLIASRSRDTVTLSTSDGDFHATCKLQ
ncbi:hypothetical protein BWI17_15810 [Betaproteobacteria bacterium GR16-43]|nr:hypothetical protein BWI17_15810 [Betaproteobacteria bacterium GR16-43]